MVERKTQRLQSIRASQPRPCKLAGIEAAAQRLGRGPQRVIGCGASQAPDNSQPGVQPMSFRRVVDLRRDGRREQCQIEAFQNLQEVV